MTTVLHPKLRALEKQFQASTLTEIVDTELTSRKLELWIKRDDLLHPVISGNKWRKLKYILNHALFSGADTIVSMGGAYSNHLHALAFAGKRLGLKTIAFVRGERPDQLNPTLIDLLAWGMELRFISRADYRLLRTYKTFDSLPGLKSAQYWLPEGGASELALLGVVEIIAEIDREFDVMLVACGTGTTLAGLVAAAPMNTKLLGVAALKGADFLHQDVRRLLGGSANTDCSWEVLQDYHCGGFAKTTLELQACIKQFHAQHGVELEPVYTGKVLLAFQKLLKQGYFEPAQRVVILHTGGLQGNRG